jgi:hypothetical protein
MISDRMKKKILSLGEALIDQKRARIIVKPYAAKPGFWFGGGNILETPEGEILVVGRYRNSGDSTTGLAKGERGLELAVFRSGDGGESFSKALSFSKEDLGVDGKKVLSIEGAALSAGTGGFELFVSTEKDGIGYPPGLEAYKKPGTGVWTIERIAASSLEGLKKAPLKTAASCRDPRFTHVKDPGIFRRSDGATVLFFCTHPYGWSSSNSAYSVRPAGGEEFGSPVFDFFPRGYTWDIAVTRLTDIFPVPGNLLGGSGTVNLAFYDGAECLRHHTENAKAVSRPRGYSCEEIAGLAVFEGDDINAIERISVEAPLFVSPWGTGSCRYIHCTAGKRGIYATWQQSRETGEQPLVMNFLSWDEVRRVLA